MKAYWIVVSDDQLIPHAPEMALKESQNTLRDRIPTAMSLGDSIDWVYFQWQVGARAIIDSTTAELQKPEAGQLGGVARSIRGRREGVCFLNSHCLLLRLPAVRRFYKILGTVVFLWLHAKY